MNGTEVLTKDFTAFSHLGLCVGTWLSPPLEDAVETYISAAATAFTRQGIFLGLHLELPASTTVRQ
jgi:hypothetical protein